ncbi:MAG TPA: sensor domain-containing diguanylate cyclase [Rhodocyclaceae bacterium]|nr:sensor domain-containing diguanylate cyclase [Rhodocyclaceae bacterium]
MSTHEQLMQIIKIQTEIAKLGLDLGGVMQYVAEQTLPLIAADGSVIELAEDGEMVYRAAAGIAKDQLGLRLKIATSLSGLCVMTGETLSCNDSETDPRVDRLACQKIGLRSMIVMPLKHGGVTVGVLKAMSAKPNGFQQEDMTLLGMLSEVVAAAMYFSVKYDSDNLFIKATHDGMTGLANRALFMDRLRNVVARTSREQRPSGVLMIDMDGLKQINDTHGHRIGDAVIIEFSDRIRKATRDTDTAARLGGDEFGIILSPLENADGIDSAVRRIDSQIAPPFVFENRQYQLKASIGSALAPEDGAEPDKLLEVADQRMYAVKQSRKKQG